MPLFYKIRISGRTKEGEDALAEPHVQLAFLRHAFLAYFVTSTAPSDEPCNYGKNNKEEYTLLSIFLGHIIGGRRGHLDIVNMSFSSRYRDGDGYRFIIRLAIKTRMRR